jgi:hypothetical protein
VLNGGVNPKNNAPEQPDGDIQPPEQRHINPVPEAPASFSGSESDSHASGKVQKRPHNAAPFPETQPEPTQKRPDTAQTSSGTPDRTDGVENRLEHQSVIWRSSFEYVTILLSVLYCQNPVHIVSHKKSPATIAAAGFRLPAAYALYCSDALFSADFT